METKNSGLEEKERAQFWKDVEERQKREGRKASRVELLELAGDSSLEDDVEAFLAKFEARMEVK